MPIIFIISFIFTLGTYISHFVNINKPLIFVLSLILFIIYICLFILNYRKNNLNRILSIISLTLIFILSISNTYLKLLKPPEYIEQISAYQAIIIEEVKTNEYSDFTTAEIQKIKFKNRWIQKKIKIKLFLNRKSNLKYGDVLLVNSSPKKMGNKIFDNYLKRINIHLKHYLNKQNQQWMHSLQRQHPSLMMKNKRSDKMLKILQKNSYIIINNKIQNIFFYYSIKIKRKLEKILKENIKNLEALSITSALLLGSKELLNIEIKNLYRDTGIIHILALSGLHLGIIIWIISILISLFMRKIKYKATKLIFTISAVWLFAFITGLSPSIIRAATMFTIFQISFMINKNSNPYSIFASSIFIITLINPFIVNNIGFNLSFLSVLGIIYFQPKLAKLQTFKNKILKYFWDMTTYSISAQIITSPLILFYFNQLPIYAFLANWLMIPIGFLIICNGILILIFNKILFISNFVGFVNTKIILISNSILSIIQNFPVSIMDDFNLKCIDVFILYLTILLMILINKFRKMSFLILLNILFIISCINRVNKIYNKRKENFIIIDKRKKSFLTIKYGYREIHLFKNKKKYFLKINGSFKDINKQKIYPIKIWRNIIFLVKNNKLLAIIDKRIKSIPKNYKKIKIEKLILKNNYIKQINQLNKLFKIGSIELYNFKIKDKFKF